MLLIVEDEKVSRKALAALLMACGYSVQAVGSAEEALQLVDSGEVPEVALVDLDLPGMSGEQLLRHLSHEIPSIRTILLSAADSDRLASLGHDWQVLHLRKPIDFDQLLSLLPKHAATKYQPHDYRICG